ncbi:MAG: glucose-6-phosphate dehydrogenase [Planctomycetes bacterium]|nr:glucose-6-phosphate dehydrogenase [Planctomycetota bacterium]
MANSTAAAGGAIESNPLGDELRSSRTAAPCVLVIFGATGDLTKRKLVPSLMGLAKDGLLPPGFAVVGFARRDWSDEKFRAELADGVRQFGRSDTLAAWETLADAFTFHQSDFADAEGYAALRTRLEQIDRQRGTAGNRIFYLATPPSSYSPILENLARTGLSQEQGGRFARVIVEKPFGRDLASATALNDQVCAAFHERQVFRIDHYLGKETVQNILALRFANGIFEPLWNEKFVDHVQITVAESIGVGSRGGYFEESGIIRDMIQNHLMQVLTLVAMEPPASLTADAVRDEKVKVLKAIRSFRPEQVDEATVRAQYTGGPFGGESVRGYREEDGVPANSSTETYAAVRLSVENWRWARTPFFLRSGKRLPRRVTEVAIQFKQPPHLLFAGKRPLQPNVLLLRIQPDEGVALRFGAKVPGPDVRVRDVRMDFRYGTAFGGESADAYERLLLDSMLGDGTLFARGDEVAEAWRIVDSIVAGWKQSKHRPDEYTAGTWGPERAARLLGAGREWRKP